ncbi:hypothetical protein [Bradyrhizobium sp. S3.5.5]|uniref:hypothetical protein n=1 Tax=Bradyrhizobium sp. S3.5.5 TaxID=3156430 RepID=UPI003391000F
MTTTTIISRPARPARTTTIRRSDIDDKTADRTKLATFATTIGAARTSLKRDACGDWLLRGLTGHLSTDGDAIYAYLACSGPRAWNNAKQKLDFLTIHEDGDDEGVLRLDRPLTTGQAETLRVALRIRKARAMDEAALEVLTLARQRSERSPCYEAS